MKIRHYLIFLLFLAVFGTAAGIGMESAATAVDGSEATDLSSEQNRTTAP